MSRAMARLLFTIVLIAAQAGLSGVRAQTGGQVKVGLIVPYTGVYALLGKEIDDGFMLALEEFGVTGSFSIQREDTEAKPDVGLAKTQKLIDENRVDVLVGVVSSGVLATIRDLVHSSKVPLIVANAGNDEITGKRCSKYISRLSFSNSQVNRPMGKWLYDRGIRKVYTLGPNYYAGYQHVGSFSTAFVESGGTITGAAFTPFGATKDFAPYLQAAMATNPDAIYVFYAGGEAINFVKQYEALGFKKTTPLFGSGFLTSAAYVNKEGPAAEGIITSLHYVPVIDTPVNKAFVERYKAKVGRAPSEYAVQGYDAGHVLAVAVKGGATDRESLAAFIPRATFPAPRGRLKMSPLTHNIVQNVYIYETVAGPEGLTQKIVATIPDVSDPRNGCNMPME
jgi:branched-chain amino acid transport system substrate-binding protein